MLKFFKRQKASNTQKESEPKTHFPEDDADTKVKPTAEFWHFMGTDEMKNAKLIIENYYKRLKPMEEEQNRTGIAVPKLSEESTSYYWCCTLYKKAVDAGKTDHVNFRFF